MCILTEYSDEDQVVVYKVVAKKDDGYYSIAMGIKYKIGEYLPMSTEITQNPIGNHFSSDILSLQNYGSFEYEMSGRTSGFKSLGDTYHLLQRIQISNNWSEPCNIRFIVVKIILSKDLMTGTYGKYEVIAGRMITKIVEI